MPILVALPLVIFLLAMAGLLFSSLLTQKVAKGHFIRSWKLSCFLSSLLVWTMIWFAFDIVAILVWVSTELEENFLLGMISIFLGGPLATFIILKGSQIQNAYWKEIAKSLDRCIHLNNEQKEILNFEIHLLRYGTRTQRNTALNKILFPSKYEVVNMSHHLSDDEE